MSNKITDLTPGANNFHKCGISDNCKIAFCLKQDCGLNILEIWTKSGDNQDFYNVTHIHGFDSRFINNLRHQLSSMQHILEEQEKAYPD